MVFLGDFPHRTPFATTYFDVVALAGSIKRLTDRIRASSTVRILDFFMVAPPLN
jgi:hypothetical protein